MIVAFVGLDRAGKSSIKVYLESLSLNSAMNTKISNGVETYLVRNFRIDVFPGQEKLRYEETLYERLFPLVDVVALVVDASDKERFDEVRRYWEFLRKMIRKYTKGNVRIILVAHKQDIKGAIQCSDLKRIIFGEDRSLKVACVDTSIYDPISMSLLLRILHGAEKVGIEAIVDALREKARSHIAMIFDGHLLPIAISGAKPNSETFDRINDLIVALERYGRIKALMAVFENQKVFILSKQGGERVIFCLIDPKVDVGTLVELCDKAMRTYLREMRKRLWRGL